MSDSKTTNRLRIGQRIAELRQEKGLSVRQLAEKCDISYQNIYKIEGGRYNVSVDILNKLLTELDARLDIVK